MTANAERRSVFDSCEDAALVEGLEEVTSALLVSPPLLAGTSALEQAETRVTVEEDVKFENARQAGPHGEVSDKMFCSTCQCPFENREEQLEHYKLDWHRFNLRQRLAGRLTVTAEDFERKTGVGDVSSISGSDSEDEASDTNCGIHGDEVPTPAEAESSDEMRSTRERLASRVLFRNSRGRYLSVFRCVLSSRKSDLREGDLVASLLSISSKSLWVVLMAGGGHFAGAVFQGKEILHHKTFHRYTVRAKRGTAQGLRDSQNRSHVPKSAGAALRRYNEAALVKDVQELLESWLEYLREASAIFLRAPSYNKAMFFGSRLAPLDKNDPRVRTLPFATRRATFREVVRVHENLSSLHIYGENTEVLSIFSPQRKPWKAKTRESRPQTACEKDLAGESSVAPPVVNEEDDSSGEASPELEMVEESLSTLDLRESEVLPRRRRRKKRKGGPRAQLPDSSGRECEEQDGGAGTADSQGGCEGKSRTAPSTEKDMKDVLQYMREYALRDSLFTACKVGDLDALRRLLQLQVGDVPPEGAPANTGLTTLINEAIDPSGFTLLHVASAAGQRGVVRTLMDAGSDPALRDKKGQTPYSVAAEKDTRNEFRKYMAEHPDKYDYGRAQVPGPLTADIEAKKTEKKREQKAMRKQREKERKEEKKKEEAERDEKKRFVALSDREKRALAAERRLEQQMALAGLSNVRRCWQCGESLVGKVPFQYLDFSFCTPRCVQEHRKARASNPKN